MMTILFRPQCAKLFLHDAIMCQCFFIIDSILLLIQEMACHPLVSSHYLHQFWFTTNWMSWNKLQLNPNRFFANMFLQDGKLEYIVDQEPGAADQISRNQNLVLCFKFHSILFPHEWTLFHQMAWYQARGQAITWVNDNPVNLHINQWVSARKM